MTSRLRAALALKPPVMSIADAARLAGPTIVILAGFALAGHYLLGLLIALGTYTVLFGGVADRRHRLAVMTASGAGLVVAVTAGILAAGSLAWTLVAYCATTLAAAVLDEALTLGPPGPAFFVLMVGGGLTIGAAHVRLGHVLPPVALGTVVALLAAMAGPGRPGPPAEPRQQPLAARVRKRLTWPSEHAVTGARIVLAVVILTVIAWAVADPHPFWAVLVALLVLSYPGGTDVLVLRAVNRVAGTIAGILVFWLWNLAGVSARWDFVAIGVLLWAASRLAPRNYAYASIVITVLALLMTQPLVSGVSAGRLALNRLADTGLAAAVCLLALAFVRPRHRPGDRA